jgi:hypothetical protein
LKGILEVPEPKLHQVIAVKEGVVKRTHERLSRNHHMLAKPTLLAGFTKSYEPLTEEGEKLQGEETRVQVRVDEVIADTIECMTELLDTTATVDFANCEARADVVVDGQVVLTGVPVTHLLFLEKEMVKIHEFVKELPTLDPAEVWSPDEGQNCFRSRPIQKSRSKKVPRVLVKAEATEHHPAQTEVWHEDILVGYWTEIKYSGCTTAKRVKELLLRVEKLQRAIKFAREEANASEATARRLGEKVFGFIFGT